MPFSCLYRINRCGFSKLLLWCVVGFSIGMLVAPAETQAYLPLRLLLRFHLPSESNWIAMVGWALGRTLIVPILFIIGLHRKGFHYTVRMICCIYWCVQGVIFWQCLKQLHGRTGDSVFYGVLLLGIFLILAFQFWRSYRIADAGPFDVAKSARSYWIELCRSWGAMLLTYAAFYQITLRLI